jgi:WXG100 family type VII secretion target
MPDGYGLSEEELAQASKDVADVNEQTQSQLRTLRGQLEPLASAWQGAAATAFMQLMARFDEDAAKIQQALGQIGESLHASYTTYVQQEEEQSSSMSNITGRLG